MHNERPLTTREWTNYRDELRREVTPALDAAQRRINEALRSMVTADQAFAALSRVVERVHREVESVLEASERYRFDPWPLLRAAGLDRGLSIPAIR